MPLYVCGFNLHNQLLPEAVEAVCCPTLCPLDYDVESNFKKNDNLNTIDDIFFMMGGVYYKVSDGKCYFRGQHSSRVYDPDLVVKLSCLASSGSGRTCLGVSAADSCLVQLSSHQSLVPIPTSPFPLNSRYNAHEEVKEFKKFKTETDSPSFDLDSSTCLEDSCGKVSIKTSNQKFCYIGLYSKCEAVAFDADGGLWQSTTNNSHQEEEPQTIVMCPVASMLCYRVEQVCVGADFGVLRTSVGEVFSWGGGARGELGHGSDCRNSTIPRRVDALGGVVIRLIAAGAWHCLALGSCGEVYVWGWNCDGQLGLPFKKAPAHDIHACVPHCCAGLCNADGHSECEDVSSTPSEHTTSFVNVQYEPVMLTALEEEDEESENELNEKKTEEDKERSDIKDVIDIAAGARHSVFLMADGKVKVCGWNKYGQLGVGCSRQERVPLTTLRSGLSGKKVARVRAALWYTAFETDQ